MTAPDTNTTKQARRHRPAMIALAICLVVIVLYTLTSVFWPTPPIEDQAAPEAGVDTTTSG